MVLKNYFFYKWKTYYKWLFLVDGWTDVWSLRTLFLPRGYWPIEKIFLFLIVDFFNDLKDLQVVKGMLFNLLKSFMCILIIFFKV